MAQAVPEYSAVAVRVISAGTSAVSRVLVSYGMRFGLDDWHDCAIIILRDGVVEVMAVDGERVVGWPFAESASVLQLLMVGVDFRSAITGEVL